MTANGREHQLQAECALRVALSCLTFAQPLEVLTPQSCTSSADLGGCSAYLSLIPLHLASHVEVRTNDGRSNRPYGENGVPWDFVKQFPVCPSRRQYSRQEPPNSNLKEMQFLTVTPKLNRTASSSSGTRMNGSSLGSGAPWPRNPTVSFSTVDERA